MLYKSSDFLSATRKNWFIHTDKISFQICSDVCLKRILLYGNTVMSHEHHDVSNHQWLDCLFNTLFRVRSKNHQSSALLAICKGIGGSTTQRTSNVERVSMLWCHHGVLECYGSRRLVPRRLTYPPLWYWGMWTLWVSMSYFCDT